MDAVRVRVLDSFPAGPSSGPWTVLPGRSSFRLRIDGLSREAARDFQKHIFSAQTGEAALVEDLDPAALLWWLPDHACDGLVPTLSRHGERFHSLARKAQDAMARFFRTEFAIPCRGRELRMGRRTLLMGIMNVTPDSFSDGGDFLDAQAAIHQGLRLVSEGADILDIGGESTRPGSDAISPEEELRRVLPVIEGLRDLTDAPISIDTHKAAVAEEALRAGADMVNDIFGFQRDPELAAVAAAHRAPAVLMHIRGTPKTMNVDTTYRDLIGEMIAYLEKSIEIAVTAGLPEEWLIVDPGIGFAKRHLQNLEILNRLHEFRTLGRPILVGPSRKSFIGQTLGLPPKERLLGTAAAVALAAAHGAHILRVHDVREMRQVLDVADAVRCPDPGPVS